MAEAALVSLSLYILFEQGGKGMGRYVSVQATVIQDSRAKDKKESNLECESVRA